MKGRCEKVMVAVEKEGSHGSDEYALTHFLVRRKIRRAGTAETIERITTAVESSVSMRFFVPRRRKTMRSRQVRE